MFLRYDSIRSSSAAVNVFSCRAFRRRRVTMTKAKRESLTTQSFTNSIDGSEVKLFGEQLQGGSKIDFAQLKFMYENIFPDKKIPEKEMYNMQKCADFLIDYTDFINMDAEQQVEFILALMRTFYRKAIYGDNYIWDDACTATRLASSPSVRTSKLSSSAMLILSVLVNTTW